MSKIRDEAEHCIESSPIDTLMRHDMMTVQAKRVLIFLGAVETIGNNYESMDGKDAYYVLLGAIKQAEEV